MKIIAIDYGDKRIGIAISDEEGRIARRFKTLENKGRDWTVVEIENITRDENVRRIVIGIPVGLKNDTHQTETVKLFIKALTEKIKIPVFSVNEVYTTKMAEKNLLDKGMKSKDIRRVVDQEAARIILQEYLDVYK